jgi:hypothetical protein
VASGAESLVGLLQPRPQRRSQQGAGLPGCLWSCTLHGVAGAATAAAAARGGAAALSCGTPLRPHHAAAGAGAGLSDGWRAHQGSWVWKHSGATAQTCRGPPGLGNVWPVAPLCFQTQLPLVGSPPVAQACVC